MEGGRERMLSSTVVYCLACCDFKFLNEMYLMDLWSGAVRPLFSFFAFVGDGMTGVDIFSCNSCFISMV